MFILTHCLQIPVKMGSKMRGISRTIYQGIPLLENDKCGDHNFEKKLKRYETVQNNSYMHQVGTNLQPITICQLISTMSDRYGDRLAVIDRIPGIRKTFSEFQTDIEKLATGLLALNLQRGDRVGIWSPNRYEWTVALLAGIKAGLIMAAINPVYQPRELEFCLKKLQIRAIVAPDNFRIMNYYKIMSMVVPELVDAKPGEIKSKSHPYFEKLILMTDQNYPGAFRFQDVMDAGGSTQSKRLQELDKKIQIHDIATLIFTSGTTGNPKAAIHTHFEIMNNCIVVSENTGFFDEPHVSCCNVPLFHIFGCHGVICNSILTGMTIVLPAPGFHVELSLKAIEDEKCTCVYGTPTMYVDFFNNPNFSQTNLSSIKTGCVSGAPCPPNLVKKIINEFPCPGLIVGYGSTEMNVLSCHHYRDNLEIRMQTDGRILPNSEVKVVNRDNEIVPYDTPGEICVRNPYMMKGYWEEDEKNKEAFKDGWFYSGDEGTLSRDGYIKIVGRIKDLIIRGGENINPGEIEDILMAHSKITEAHVIGVPDQRMGEDVCAVIKIKENQVLYENEVKEYCKGQLSYFKIPRYVQFVDDFPRTAIGKVKKFVLREDMAKILNVKATE